MRILHCADIHLDSKMETNLDKKQAKERRGELLNTFTRMVRYAEDNAVDAVLIAGDLFDRKSISAAARNTVLDSIKSARGIVFYILQGNHDEGSLFGDGEEHPENVRLFGERWKAYLMGNVVISGVELNADNSAGIYNELVLDMKYFNIVMLHGQAAEAMAKDKTEVINLKALRGKGIDYLALGHVHEYKYSELPGGGKYCYPGCLEGRGFDECGQHGFVLMDVDEATHSFTHEFVPFAGRNMYTVPVELEGDVTSPDVIAAARRAIMQSGAGARDLIKLELLGNIDAESELDYETVRAAFKDDFYFVKVKDSTRPAINEADYLYDKSLKGEFVRSVMADESLSEEDKAAVIRYGLNALKDGQ